MSSAIERTYNSDRLFDAVAGLEGLLLGNAKTELRHQFAERVALLLGSELNERTEINQKMKKAYDLRSKVAHGSMLSDNLPSLLEKQNPSKKEIEEFNSINELSGFCQKSLQDTLIFCIKKGNVDFNWNDSIMSGKLIK